MTKAISTDEAVEKAKIAERRTKKVVDPARRKHSNIPKHKATRYSTAPSSTVAPIQQAEQIEALFEAFFVGPR